MPKKKKIKNNENDLDNEIIIGYNTKKKESPPDKKRKKKKTKKKKSINKDKETKKKIDGQAKPVKKKKKKKKKGTFKKVLKVLLKIIIVLAIGTAIVLFLFVSPVFNIQEIEVFGASEISESVYIAMAGIEIGDNIFEIDKIGGETTIKNEAYVEDVKIKSIYPGRVEINVIERVVCYITEADSKFFYLDKNGYILETSFSAIDLPKIIGCTTDFASMEVGDRLNEDELNKFNDLIKITDAIQNNDIDAKLTSINIEDENNYILEFAEENKKVMLGKASDLSAKMAWVNLFIKDRKNDKRKHLFKFR